MGRMSRDGVGQTWLDKLLKRDPRKVLERRENNDLLDLWGGIQGCPWCHQTMQRFPDTRMKVFSGDDMLDEMWCGNCGGSSLWRFEVGMIFVCVGETPKPTAKGGFGDDEFITNVIQRAQAHIAARPTPTNQPNGGT